MAWFYFFLIYSFLGFCLEVVFARVTRNPKRDRKCFYLLPLCPVYGFGALAVLLLPEFVRASAPLLFVAGGLAATAAEYLMGLFYEKIPGVVFWDYAHLPWNVGGKVCLLFSGFWGLLALGLTYGLHPAVAAWAAGLPDFLALPLGLFLAADGLLTLSLLTRTHSPDSLKWVHSVKPVPAPGAPHRSFSPADRPPRRPKAAPGSR